jgi:hypothetical protein
MARFLIEVPHEGKAKECALAVNVLLSSGSHYLTNAEFGCLDGEHKAWIIVEMDSKEDALFILPPVYRPKARIVELNKFSLEEINAFLEKHPD